MENPTCYDELVAAVKERASYGQSRYSEICSSLKVCSVEELEVKQGKWHKRCYQDATHSGLLMRAKERYERVLAEPNESRSKTHQPTHSTEDNPLQQSSSFLLRSVVKDVIGKSSGKLELSIQECHYMKLLN